MKVIVKGRENRDQLEIFSIEGFVPADHLLRKIDSAVDFNHIYDIVEDLYCADNGRPSIDPVVIFKMVLIQHLYGLPSLRRTVEDIRHTPEYKALYERRKETIERVFADAKEKYAMRYTPYRGLSQVTNWVRLKFATMNLKKYALHRWKRSHQYSALINLYIFFAKTKLITLNLAWNLGLFDRLKASDSGGFSVI